MDWPSGKVVGSEKRTAVGIFESWKRVCYFRMLYGFSTTKKWK